MISKMNGEGAPISPDLQKHINEEYGKAINKLCVTQDKQLEILGELKLAVNSISITLNQIKEERSTDKKNSWDMRKSVVLLGISTVVSAMVGYFSGSKS